ncbi:MAG: hypothetical protein QXS14_03965 [Desulfurococcaceae archaeon]
MSEKPEFKEIADKVLDCLKELKVHYTEMHVYPKASGYRVEIYPTPTREFHEILVECITKTTGLKTVIAEKQHGLYIVVVKKD